MIADKMNDVNFSPISVPYPHLHHIYTKSKDCSHKMMGNVGIITSDKVKFKLADMRVKLTRIIQDWSRSGEGSGGKGAEEVTFGDVSALMERPENDDRSSFLRNDPPHILYLWQKSFEINFLSTVVQRIHPSIGAASAQNCTSVYPAIGTSGTGKKNKKRVVSPTNEDDDTEGSNKDSIGNKVIKVMQDTTVSFEITRLREAISKANKELFDLRRKVRHALDDDDKAIINDRIKELQTDLSALNEEYNTKKAQSHE
jgi:hypothetical protein